ADGDQREAAARARHHYASALHYLSPLHPEWAPEVLCVSAQTGEGIAALWERVEAHRAALEATGALAAMRADQAVRWMWHVVEQELGRRLRAHPEVAAVRAALEAEV